MSIRSGNNSRVFRSVKLFAPGVREILNLPNPTTPTAVVSGPAVAVVGEAVTLMGEVTDPDYGDSWTYVWRESSASVRGRRVRDSDGC